MTLHQSAPLVDSLNHVARPALPHSNLISVAVQDGELFAVDCPVFRTDRHIDWNVEDSPSPPDGSRMFPRPLQTLHPWGTEGLGQNAAVGLPYRPEIRPWGASPSNGGWVPFLLYFFIVRVWVPSYPLFSWFIDVFPGIDFLRKVCALSTCVFALDELDSIGPRVSWYLDVAVVFFDRFFGICGKPTRLSHLSVGHPSHSWRGLQPLWKNDGWLEIGWCHCRQPGGEFDRRRDCGICAKWGPQLSGLGRLVPAHDLPDQFVSPGPWSSGWTGFSSVRVFRWLIF